MNTLARHAIPAASLRGAALLVTLAALAADLPPGHAACNLIPGTEKSFSAALGATNRPYAAPGERLEMKLRSCDASGGFRATGTDHVVTLVFQPLTGSKRVVVLAANCGGVDLGACTPPGVASATCVTAAAGDLTTRVDIDAGDRRLNLRFPDTDAILAPDGDDVTLAGPVAIAVTAVGEPPACGLAIDSCSAQSGLIACVDQLYANDGSCGTSVPHGQFTSFTALPPPNDYQADCFTSDPPCTGTGATVRAALDAAGNVLIPVGWGGVLVRDGSVPVPRLIRTRIASPLPFDVRTRCFSTPSRRKAGSCRRSSSRSSIPPSRRRTSRRSSARSTRRTRRSASRAASARARAAIATTSRARRTSTAKAAYARRRASTRPPSHARSTATVRAAPVAGCST
jgi:hypothetical protein